MAENDEFLRELASQAREQLQYPFCSAEEAVALLGVVEGVGSWELGEVSCEVSFDEGETVVEIFPPPSATIDVTFDVGSEQLVASSLPGFGSYSVEGEHSSFRVIASVKEPDFAFADLDDRIASLEVAIAGLLEDEPVADLAPRDVTSRGPVWLTPLDLEVPAPRLKRQMREHRGGETRLRSVAMPAELAAVVGSDASVMLALDENSLTVEVHFLPADFDRTLMVGLRTQDGHTATFSLPAPQPGGLVSAKRRWSGDFPAKIVFGVA